MVIMVDYFTKWVEAKAFKALKGIDLVDFIKEFIFIRFGIPESITVAKSPIFEDNDLLEFCAEYEMESPS